MNKPVMFVGVCPGAGAEVAPFALAERCQVFPHREMTAPGLRSSEQRVVPSSRGEEHLAPFGQRDGATSAPAPGTRPRTSRACSSLTLL